MNVTCDKCNKRYSIADEKVRGKSVKIRCKQCQNLISVQGPALVVTAAAGMDVGATPLGGGNPWQDERTRAMPAMDTSAQWFAMVKGKQLGPFDVRALEGRVKSGEVTLRTYLWRQGMADWKRASDVPEVSPVFAGVSVGATATGPTGSSADRPASKRVAAVHRDVAVANEMPSPEVTGRRNGNGHGAPIERTEASPAHQPQPRAEPAPRAKVVSQARPAVAPVASPRPEPTPMPLAGLFDNSGNHPALDLPLAEQPTGEDEPAVTPQHHDPFAALGESDPADAPPIGEATKFFIAQAGVNKRNPPWKIALFVISLIGLPLGVLFLLSSLHIVPLEVTRTNAEGEEVRESFFSAGGVSGLKDLLTGEEKRRKAAAEKAKAEAAEAARKRALLAQGPAGNPVPGKPAQVGMSQAEIDLIYGAGSVKPEKVPRVRADPDRPVVATGGLDASQVQKVVADKLKSFESCIEQALRRNPNLAVGGIEVVASVGTSGAVTSASIDPRKFDNSDWGECMKSAARRIVFPSSDGEAEVRIPLKVGVAMQ